MPNPSPKYIRPTPSSEDSAFRRQADEVLWQLVQDKFATLTGDVKELTITLRGYNGDVGLVGRITHIEARLESIYEMLSGRHGRVDAEHVPDADKPLTSGRMAERFITDWLKPVVTGIVTAVVLAAIMQLLK